MGLIVGLIEGLIEGLIVWLIEGLIVGLIGEIIGEIIEGLIVGPIETREGGKMNSKTIVETYIRKADEYLFKCNQERLTEGTKEFIHIACEKAFEKLDKLGTFLNYTQREKEKEMLARIIASIVPADNKPKNVNEVVAHLKKNELPSPVFADCLQQAVIEIDNTKGLLEYCELKENPLKCLTK